MQNDIHLSQEDLNEFYKISEKYFEQSDIDELRSNENVRVDTYFDTFDVLPMIRGYWSLRNDYIKTISKEIFDDDKFLVRSLAFFNHIKHIKLFTPYAIELYQQLDKEYLLPNTTIKQEEIDEFLFETGFKTIKNLKTKANLKAYFDELSPQSESFIKANYVLTDLIWGKRLSYLLGDNGIISIDPTKFNFKEIFRSDLYLDIYKAISGGRRRSALSINNFRDATALCMLHQKLTDFKHNNAPLPLFYTTSETMIRIGELFKDKFTVHYKGKKICILKDTEYFIVDVMFNNFNEEKRMNDAFSSLKNLKQKLDNSRVIGQKMVDNTVLEIIADWNRYRKQELFVKLWNDDSIGKAKLNDNLTQLFRYKELVKENSFKVVIEREKEKIKTKLINNVSGLSFIEDIWKELNSIDTFIKEDLRHTTHKELDIFRDLGLTKFSPPRGYVEDQLKQLWYGVMEYANSNYDRHQIEDLQRIKINIMEFLYEGFSNRNYDKLLIGVSILWVFRKFSLIVRILDALNLEYGDSYQLALIHSASLCRSSSHNSEQLIRIIDCMRGKLCFDNNYKAWIGVSYSIFNVWNYSVPTPQFIPELGSVSPSYENLLKESTTLMAKAVDWLAINKDVTEPKLNAAVNDQIRLARYVKYYYALNCLLYYIVRTEPVDKLKSAYTQKIISDLTNGNVPNIDMYWQSTFDHTLASYHYRIAILSTDPLDRKSHITSAKERIEDAANSLVIKPKAHDNYSVLRKLIFDL